MTETQLQIISGLVGDKEQDRMLTEQKRGEESSHNMHSTLHEGDSKQLAHESMYELLDPTGPLSIMQP